ncbi:MULTISPECIES: hypothetical protein [Trueperella]|uniref:Uncharacterized protein n=1 Tax=Trueperella abortisuis TaxID=445930 RepID=A0ABT9PKL1_9ACTO|nr:MULTISPECIES: hypothetical protein [Trueperella]MDP9832997.1 hypothetical protein [Trueperella abortisuis]MDY5404393.1 hypothetical protein [Trueperella sp.]
MIDVIDRLGRPCRVPEHWLSHPVLGADFSLPNKTNKDETKTPAAGRKAAK